MNAIAIQIGNERRVLSGIKPVSEAKAGQWEFENVVKPHLMATKLPIPYFWRMKKEDWHPEQERVYNRCKEMFQLKGAIAALVGPRGTGKTTVAAQLILDRAHDEKLEPWKRRPPYRKASYIIAKFKPLFGDFGAVQIDRLLRRFDDYANFDFMVIDEWHECDELKMRDRVMTDLLDRRYANNKDTLLISNQTAKDFMGSTNESTLSRMDEHGQIIPCEWDSFRSKHAA